MHPVDLVPALAPLGVLAQLSSTLGLGLIAMYLAAVQQPTTTHIFGSG